MPNRDAGGGRGVRGADVGRRGRAAIAVGSGRRRALLAGAALFALTAVLAGGAVLEGRAVRAADAEPEPFRFVLRNRVEVAPGSGRFQVAVAPESWNPRRTAFIVCDMWDSHHSRNAVLRVQEIAPRMNAVLKTARARGATIIHAPSSCMAAYADHPARRNALAIPRLAQFPEDIGKWCHKIPAEERGTYPLDQSDGGEDDDPVALAAWKKQLEAQGLNPRAPWKRQTDLLTIDDQDLISDSGEEIWSALAARKIENVVLVGVHTNMCVLGRPFGLRQMAKNGRHVVLMRDMTDTMYNPARAPFVSHFAGTDRIVEHIEKYVCPTVTSDQILGGEPFRFSGDRRPLLVTVVSEEEYGTRETVPTFAESHLVPDFRLHHVMGTADGLPGIDRLDAADVALFSVRRIAIPAEQMEVVKRYVAKGKPVVALRTSSHAFSYKGTAPAGRVEWKEFDADVLGGNYHNHHGVGPQSVLTVADGQAGHPILAGIDVKTFVGHGSLYKTSPLAASTTLLLSGTIPGQPTEPVVWTNAPKTGNRVVYASLGHRDDFADPHFVRLLVNAVHWAAGTKPTSPPGEKTAPRAEAALPAKGPVPTTAKPAPPASPKTDAKPPASSTAPAVPSPKTSATAKEAPSKAVPAKGASQKEPGERAPSATQGSSSSVPANERPVRAGAKGTREPALSPAESATRFTVPDDLVFEQMLAEPDVRQPLSLSFDERGRLWVVEYLTYPEPAGLKPLSRDSHWRTVYDKVPPPPPNHFRGRDRISIHADTDGDGRFDKHTVFVEGLSIASSCARGRGGVWVLNPPYLLFYPDANDDDVPDGDPVVHLSGFGLEDTHSVANNLRFGPDGWLYAAQGSTVSGRVLRPGLDRNPVFSMGQNIWRYHPEQRRYEIFAEGGGNAFGVEIDSRGRIFSGHNGGNTRGFHYVQGAYLQKGFGKHGPLSNPYAFGYFPPMSHPPVERFTHTFVFDEGGTLPEKYRGMLFGVEPLQGRVVLAEPRPDRSTFATKDLAHPVVSTDRWFRPVAIELGPDGALWVADFYEPQISHREHYDGTIDRDTGRIYRLKAKDAKLLAPFDLRTRPTAALVELLDHPNRWWRRTAQRLLGDRHDKSAIPGLRATLEDPQTGSQRALETLWALAACGGFDEDVALRTLAHPDPHVRSWTIRLLGDAREVASPLARRIAELARTEPDVSVRGQMASSARRWPAAEGLPIVRSLLARAEDADDPRQPLLLWWAIETFCGSDRNAVRALWDERDLWSQPLVRKEILARTMRRFAATGRRTDLALCAQLLTLAPDKEATSLLMTGFEQAYQGRPLTGLPPELAAALAKAGGGSLGLRVRQGEAAAIDEALKALEDEKTPGPQRLDLAQTFAEVPTSKAVPVLLDVLDRATDPALQSAALGALGAADDERIGPRILARLAALSDDVRDVALAVLASRATWSRALLDSVAAGRIAANRVPEDVVRRMSLHADRTVAADVAKFWKDLDGTAGEKVRARLAAAETALADGAADPAAGKRLFAKTCAKCHLLFGQGGRIGPDLTSHQRSDLRNLLVSVVHPSAEIREGFETWLVVGDDGRVSTGFLVDADPQVVVLRSAEGQNTTIRREAIEEMKRLPRSLMPDGLLDEYAPQDVRNLFAYLRSSQPVTD